MDKKLIKNYLYNLSYQVLAILVPLITTPYISRVLGADNIGIYSYTNSITQYFILFGALGLNLYGQREIAYHQQNKKEYSKTFFEIFIVKAICLAISIIAFYFLGTAYKKYTVVFYIQIIDIVASMIDVAWLFQGLEEFKKIVIRNFIIKIVGVLCIFVFIKTSDDLWLYVLTHSLTILLGNLTMWFYLPKTITFSVFKNLKMKRHIKPAVMLFIPQIAVSIYTLLDKTMIGLLTGNDAEVAYYEQSQKIIKIALTVVTSLGTVMMPRMANVFANGDKEKIHDYMSQSFRFVFFMSAPITFGMMAISRNFVPWFFGEGFDKVVLNMMLISPIIFAISLSNVMGILYLLPTNKQSEYTTSVIVGSLTNGIFNFVFIPHFLSYGAAIATVIAEFAVTAVQFYYVKKDIDLLKIFKDNCHYIIYALIMFAVTYGVGLFLNATALSTMIQVVCGITIYFALLIITKDDFIFSFIKKIKHR